MTILYYVYCYVYCLFVMALFCHLIMSSSFHFSIIEPTEDWKVEQVLWWLLLRSQGESEGLYEVLVDSLQKQLEVGKAELWDAHKQVSDILNGNDNNNGGENENIHPTSSSSKAAAATTGAKIDTIHVDIIGGYYEGQSFDVMPKAGSKNACWVGRSAGKKFRDKGISLPKDLEVSTSHGRFEYARGEFFYKDCASTNGSRIFDADIEPNVTYKLTDDMEITVGQTVMKVTLTASK